ncbi:putative sodium-coupled neutral amino acid transporter 11 isoform X2 [Pezoporus flaviventris]|uniref:putative sodium-coupled neutral amino acid transporter 11 isoform X2 n=1 Tax=Pezoporus flaviventris TaxID=889875 RepID=UPI002AB0A0C0|nr:putative sodium-coupled neutral amino acid transporter 11 isoform X2 [Pezoporus flaviventris]
MERDEPEPLPAAAQQVDDQTALVSKPRKKGGKGDLASAGFNIINSIIGSGIIGLPYSMKEAGFPLGVLLLFGVAYITDYSIILLIKGGNLSSANTYQDLVRKTYGLVGYLILSTLQFLYPFIAMISYNIITGDTLTKVFQRIPGVGTDNVLTDRHFIILLTTIIFTLPISLYRDIAKLGKVSLISLILTIVILIVVMVRTVTFSPQVPKSENAWIFAKSNAVQAVGVMSFAFICNHNSFLIYGSLEEPTLKNWSRVTHVSVSLAVIISVVFATCGYMTFTGYTEGDLFENYCRDDSLATFGRFCYGVTVILTFPLECFVTREGVLSATPLVFIIPSACYLKLSKERWNHSDNLISCLILAVGVLVMTVGFVLTVLHPQECSHGKEMFYCVSSNISSHNSTLPPQAEHQSAD